MILINVLVAIGCIIFGYLIGSISTSILIGKIFMVYFWGFIGTGLIESLHNPIILIKIFIILIISYLISFIIKRIIKI